MTNLHQLRNFPVAALGLSALLSVACGNDPAGPTGSVAGSPGSSGSSGAAAIGGSAGAAGSAALGGSNGAGSGGAAGSATAGVGGSGGGAAGSAGSAGASGAGGGPPSSEPFSFFVTSMATMYEVAKAFDGNLNDGFGGDLSYGEQGAGAGLRGADKICTAVAEKGMPGNNKTWRAFLSVTAGENGPVNAIDRIGEGPWYDRLGRVVAMNKAALQNARPMGADTAIINDLPNEFGVPNQQPDVNQDPVDNHDTLTGSNEDGELDAENMGDTCNDWTSREGEIGRPRIGHSWPRMGGGGGGELQSWIAEHEAGGCAPGANIFSEGGPPPGDFRVGAGGGYGGIYCFALQP